MASFICKHASNVWRWKSSSIRRRQSIDNLSLVKYFVSDASDVTDYVYEYVTKYRQTPRPSRDHFYFFSSFFLSLMNKTSASEIKSMNEWNLNVLSKKWRRKKKWWDSIKRKERKKEKKMSGCTTWPTAGRSNERMKDWAASREPRNDIKLIIQAHTVVRVLSLLENNFTCSLEIHVVKPHYSADTTNEIQHTKYFHIFLLLSPPHVWLFL